MASSAQHQLNSARKTIYDLDRAMLEAFTDELGERKWDDEHATYTRELNPEEKRLIADMEVVFTRCRDTMDKVVKTYTNHLEETCAKPLTHNTPDEEAKLATVMDTKEEYKVVRTAYSDAMIDIDAQLSTGGSPSTASQKKLEESKKTYEYMSDRLCEDALRYERIYRDELAQRVSTHFTAEQLLLKGIYSSMKDFSPYSQGLTLNWQDMRAARRANLSAAKESRYKRDDDGYSDGDGDLSDRLSNLPTPSSSRRRTNDDDGDDNGSHSGLSGLASDIQRKGSHAASAISSSAKNAQKSLTEMVAAHGTKTAAKSASKSVKSPFN